VRTRCVDFEIVVGRNCADSAPYTVVAQRMRHDRINQAESEFTLIDLTAGEIRQHVGPVRGDRSPIMAAIVHATQTGNSSPDPYPARKVRDYMVTAWQRACGRIKILRAAQSRRPVAQGFGLGRILADDRHTPGRP